MEATPIPASRQRPPWRPEPWQTAVAQPICFALFIISICDGTGIPLLALLAALHHLARQNIHFRICHTFIYEIDKDSSKMCRELRTSINYPGPVTEFSNASDFPNFCQQVFVPNNVLILALTGFPCTAISRGAKYATRNRDYGLHAPPSNLWWTIQAGYHILQNRFGLRLITFNENVVPANQLDKTALDNTAGHCQTMNTLPTEGAPRNRFSWTSIAYATPTTDIFISLPQQQLPPGYKMDAQASNRKYPVLRAIIPSRLYELAQAPNTVPQEEQNELRKFFIYEQITATTRFPSIPILASFMAVPQKAIAAFTRAFPCIVTISLHNQHGILVKQKCTDQVWCENCSTIARALGAAWNASTTSRHIAQLLATFASFCDFPIDFTDLILEEETFKYTGPTHICTATCPFNRTSL